MSKGIKIWDGWKITYDGEEQIVSSPVECWELFGWDIENDKNASECASLITRELFCFGFIDLTCMVGDGATLTIEVIPAKEAE